MRVDRLCREYNVRIQYRHFPLHPNTPNEGMTLEQLFAGRGMDIATAQARILERIRSEGLPYGQRTMTYNSRLAQELAMWATTQEGGDAIHDALFRAYFAEGKNLAKMDVLVNVVESVGLSSVVGQRVLDTRTYRDAVDADWQHCYESGVTGVPTFAVDNSFVVGAQPYAVLERLVVNAGAVKRAAMNLKSE